MYNINKLLKLSDNFYKLSGVFEAPPAMVKFVTDQVLNLYCSQVWLNANEEISNAIRAVKGNARFQDLSQRQMESMHIKTYQQGLVINECKNFTNKPATKILDKQVFVCPLDLDSENWKYLAPMQQKYGIEYLIQMRTWPEQIKINCFFNKFLKSEVKITSEKWNGVFDPNLKEIFLDLSLLANLTIDSFKESIHHIKNVVRHEVQHLGQWLLKDIKSIKQYPGTPGNKLRNTSVDVHGIPISKYIDTTQPERIEHSLRDIEFYTRLQDSIDDFKFKLSNNNISDTIDFAKFYVGMYTESDEKYKYYKLNASNPDDFFVSLKKNDFAKWKKAVKEFIKLIS